MRGPGGREPRQPPPSRAAAAALLVALAVAALSLPLVQRGLTGAAELVPSPLVRVAVVLGIAVLALAVLGARALPATLGRAPRPAWLALAAAAAAGEYALLPAPLSATRIPPLAVLELAVLTPLAEEWLFRGVLWHAGARLLRPGAVLAVTATAFALFHGPATSAALLHGLGSGVLLGALRLGSGSLAPCVLQHALFNALCLALG